MPTTKTKPKVLTAFTADRREFAAEVGKVARSLPDRPPAPVLAGVMVTVDAIGVDLTVTDYEVLARTLVAADVELAGRFLVHGDTLARISRHLPGDTVRVECDDKGFVTITSGTATYKLLTMPTEDYPDMSAVVSAWEDADEVLGDDAPTCRLLDMDKVKPQAAAGGASIEGSLYAKRGLQTVKLWKPRRPRTGPLYAPTNLQVGAWITWTRYTTTRQKLTTGGVTYPVPAEVEEVTGQVWCPNGPRSVWVVVEGEAEPSRVSENTYGNGEYGDNYRQIKKLEEHRYITLDPEGNVIDD